MEASLVRIGLALRAMRLVLIRAQVKLEDRGKSILSTVAAAASVQQQTAELGANCEFRDSKNIFYIARSLRADRRCSPSSGITMAEPRKRLAEREREQQQQSESQAPV